MASVNNKDIPEDFNLFGDLWTLYKKYYYPENTNTYWMNVRQDFIKFSNKYRTDFANNLSLAIIGELERRGAKGDEYSNKNHGT